MSHGLFECPWLTNAHEKGPELSRDGVRDRRFDSLADVSLVHRGCHFEGFHLRSAGVHLRQSFIRDDLP